MLMRLGKERSMVVLSRQCYGTIMVGDDIEITVVHIGGDNVRLGITAPSGVTVHRKEPREGVRRENLPAAAVGDRYLPRDGAR
jgi:carbon storage regulator